MPSQTLWPLSAILMKPQILVTGIFLGLFSCSQQQETNRPSLVFTKLCPDKTISYKLDESDTLFRETKAIRGVAYSCKVLTKSERTELLELLSRLQTTQNADSSFEIGPGESVLTVVNKSGKAVYWRDTQMRNVEFNKIVEKFTYYDSQGGFENVDLKTSFWNIDGVVEPPLPPSFVDTSKLMMPITSGL